MTNDLTSNRSNNHKQPERTQIMSKTFGVQCGLFSDEIHAGEVNDKGTAFVDKSPVTTQVLRAVTDWVQRHYDGAATITLEDGRKVDIVVKEASNGRT